LYCETLYTHLNFGWSQLKGLRDGEWKYIQAPRSELYRVSLDPTESRNLITAEPRLAEDRHDLLLKMEQTLTAMRAGEKEKARAIPSEEVRLRLESLGYVCAPREAPSAADKPTVDPKDMVPVLESIDLAQKLYVRGEIRQAIEQFEAVLEHDAENIFIHYLLGDLYRQVEDYGQAMGHYLVVVKEQEDYLEVQNNLGSVYDRLGNYERALEHFKTAASLHPDQAKDYHNMGIIYIKTNRLTEAENSFRQALDLSRDNMREKAAGYKGVGDTFLRLNNPEKARQYYQQALELQPGLVKIHHELGRYYIVIGQFSLAVPEWEMLTSLSPGDAQPFFTLGQCILLIGQRDEAREALQRCLQIQPDLFQARQLLERLGQ